MDNSSEHRLQYLNGLLKEDPRDPFVHYAICLELKKSGDLHAMSSFLSLLESFPDYLPGYYQAALFLAESGLMEKAAQIAESGISLANIQKDFHALSELKSLRQNILAGEYD